MILTHSIEELKSIGVLAESLGAKAQIVGGWVWAKFNTKPGEETREKMKAAGYKWSKSKSRWYFVGAISTAKKRHSWNQITSRYQPMDIEEMAA